jgi:hypothetical protein
MESFGEVLSYFKGREEEDVENITPLIEDSQLRSGLVAWKSVSIRFIDGGARCESLTDVEKWDWLWDQVEFNQDIFGVVAGFRTQDIGAIFLRLKGLRLIYPDGTINNMARQFLQSQILQKLSGKKSPGRPKKEVQQ